MGVIVIGVDRDPARKCHVELHLNIEYLICLFWITHLKDAALLFECYPFRAKGLAKVMDSQYSKTMACDCSFKARTRLPKIEGCFNDKKGVHG